MADGTMQPAMAEQGVNFQGKRVCVVGPFPPRAGELSGQVELFCQALQGEGAWVRRVNTDVRAVRRLPLIGIHLLPLAQIVLVAWRLLGAAPRSDIIHVFAVSGWGFWLPVMLALLVGRLYRRRVVISLSGGESGDFLRGSWRRVLPLLNRADVVAVTSDYLKEIVGRFGQKAQRRAESDQSGAFPCAGPDRVAGVDFVDWRPERERQPGDGVAGVDGAAQRGS